MATEAGDAAAIHHTLHEIIALHAILVRSAIRKMSEARLAELVLFELPIILEVESGVESDRPVVIFALDGIRERAALRMALDASIVGTDVAHARGILNIRARGLCHVFAARAMATFAAHIPFGDGVIADIEVHGMAAVAKSAGGTLEIIRRIERGPPIAVVRDEVGAPDVVHDVPLGRLRIIIVADFGEVALFPEAAVDQAHVVAREFFHRVAGQIGQDGVGMLARIAYHVGHGRFLPARVDFGVAGLTGARAHVTRRELGLRCARRLRRGTQCRRLLSAQLHRIERQQ